MSSGTSSSRLNGILSPKSIAVVGASTRPGTVGNDIFRNLLFCGFNGPVYPINPKAGNVMGVFAYPTLSDVPGPIDLAVLIIPSAAALGVIDEAIAKKVRGLVVISAGFKEVGQAGAVLEDTVRQKVQAAGIPLIGPNCLGVINTHPEVRMNATFGRKMPAAGNLGFLSQSGALCTSVLDYAEDRNMGFSKFISFGNKADINEIDLLDYLAEDEDTAVIAMYLEDITNGRQFIERARKIFWETHKPMLCLKSGRSAEGAKAVSSHTGSLAGSDSVYDALLAQSGVQRVDTISELFDYAALYTTQPLPRGPRVAIITNAGGPGIMATDAAIRNGLQLAALSDATKEKLRPCLPAAAALGNPVDVIGDAHSDRYKAAVRTVLEDPGVDMGIVILTPQSMTEIEETAAVVPEAVKGIHKPVVCSFMGVRDVASGVAILRQAHIPNYPFPEDGVRALAAAVRLVTLQEIPHRTMVDLTDCDVARAEDHRDHAGRQRQLLHDPGRMPPAVRVLSPAAAEERHRLLPRGCGQIGRRNRRTAGHESHVGRRGPQVRCRRRAPQDRGRRTGPRRFCPDPRKRAKARARRQDPGHSDRADGPQGRRGHPGRQPRRPLRTPHDVRLGRHAGRGPQGRFLPPRPHVADLGRAHGPLDQGLQAARGLPRHPALRRRLDRSTSCCGSRTWSATIPRSPSWTSTR